MTTNKYEHAACVLTHAAPLQLNHSDGPAYDLAIILLRAAAKLPEGVDPVQVLRREAERLKCAAICAHTRQLAVKGLPVIYQCLDCGKCL